MDVPAQLLGWQLPEPTLALWSHPWAPASETRHLGGNGTRLICGAVAFCVLQTFRNTKGHFLSSARFEALETWLLLNCHPFVLKYTH